MVSQVSEGPAMTIHRINQQYNTRTGGYYTIYPKAKPGRAGMGVCDGLEFTLAGRRRENSRSSSVWRRRQGTSRLADMKVGFSQSSSVLRQMEEVQGTPTSGRGGEPVSAFKAGRRLA